MAVGPLRLTLLVPGLFGPLPGMGLADFPEPEWPGLKRLLSRARCFTRSGDSERLRYELLGYSLSDTQDSPAAWLSYQIDTGRVPVGPILRADPVHLRADQNRLVLFDATGLSITEDESQALIAAFNQLYASDGLQLEAPTAQRWYLHLGQPAALSTTPIEQVVGCDINSYLPHGADARTWASRLTEIQMLFHGHSVNQQREAQGRPVINSFWLWGGGEPLTPVAQAWQRIWSDNITSRGLARLNGLRCTDVPVTADDWLKDVVGDTHLVEIDSLCSAVAYADVEAWHANVEQLDQQWFKPIVAALRDGRLSEVELYPANGKRYCVKRSDLWRFWRRDRSLLGEHHAVD